MAKAMEGMGWQIALIDIDRAAEFAGDDVDRYSGLVDLGRECSGVIINLPTLTAATIINVYGQMAAAIATVPLALNHIMPDDGAMEAWATVAGTGDIMILCPCLGAIRYVRIYSSVNQAADRSISLLGTVV